MRCPQCKTAVEIGGERSTCVACPRCGAALWIGDDPAGTEAEEAAEAKHPEAPPAESESVEIDLSCPGLEDPETGVALTRTGNIGIFRDMQVFVDGLQVGRLAHDERKVFRARPGSRAVSVKMDWCGSQPCVVHVAEGEIVELRCGPGSGAGSYKLNTLKALFAPGRFFFVERAT